MSMIDDILKALMAVPQQAQGILGNLPLGIPQGEIKNAQGDVVFPTNALERGLQGSDNAAQSYAAAFMGPGARNALAPAMDRLSGPVPLANQQAILNSRLRQIQYDRSLANKQGFDTSGEGYAGPRNEAKQIREYLRILLGGNQ